ncbi:MAG: HEAT repeat domain-containing protein [Gemmatimonadetes bacterium]|nr:HEAT repeat domain-containing protein [Gemmatimonadota bacterium]
MENALTLARHFARLVWLLIHEPDSVDEQKAALRAVVTVSKDKAARLSVTDGRLMVNDVELPNALSGASELIDRLGRHGIAELEIAEHAVAADLLTIARLLAEGSGNDGVGAEAARQLLVFEAPTVRLMREAATAPVEVARAPATVTLSAFAPDSPERATLQQLAEATDPQVASGMLDNLMFVAETAFREGRVVDAALLCAALQEIEAQMIEIEVRRFFLVALRRLTKPNFLRPIANLVATNPEHAVMAANILDRFGQDGVDALVDQYINAHADAERELYRAALVSLPGVRSALTQMLSDPRWFMARHAVLLLGDLGAAQSERAVAELLNHADERVRRAAVRTLARAETAFVFDAMARALADASPSVRLAAIAALVARKSTRSATLLSAAIDDEEQLEVQFALLAALGRIATPDSVQKLIKATESGGGLFKTKKNAGLRVAAVHALAEARTPNATNALRSLQSDRDKEVAEAARLALAAPRPSAA